MSAATSYPSTWPAGPPAGLPGLLDAAEAAVGALTAGADVATMADGEAAAVMATLTTLVGRLDGLRAVVAHEVAERGLFGQAGARNLTGWLRADARVADDAWKLARLATSASRLPKITGLLGAGEVSLSQAATACWQISQLPDLPRRPDESEASGAAGDPGALNALGVAVRNPDGHDGADTTGGREQFTDDEWAGLWRLGDVRAAADELFSTVLPQLDSARLRQLGAHLREAADARQRVEEEYNDFARRGLRISRSLGGCGEISGRLHGEAAEQVIAAFEELGAKTGPDDPRTKPQRWADVLTRLCASATAPAAPLGDPPAGPVHPEAASDHPGVIVSSGTGHDHGGPRPAGYQRPRLIVAVPLATLLRQPLAAGAAVLGPATPLTGEAARRLACDADVIRLVASPQPAQPGSGSGTTATTELAQRLAAGIAQLPPPLAGPSAVLDIGRKSPGWTPRQRDALSAQYGGHCAQPGCSGPIDVIHHIVHWADGGKTNIANGLPCCLYHHWMIHEGGWRVKKQPGGTVTALPPPPGSRPGTVYRHGKPLPEDSGLP